MGKIAEGGEMEVHTNLLSQLLQPIGNFSMLALACFNLHLGASVFLLGLQGFASLYV